MSQTLEQTDQRALVLHIAAPASQANGSAETQTIGQWISGAGAEVASCPDVYLGLARLLRSPKLCAAVIVCVNDLSTPEFEFFSILAKVGRDLPVLVYGSNAPQRVIQALENGAKGLATREAVVDLCATLQRRSVCEDADTASPAPPQVVEPAGTLDPAHNLPSTNDDLYSDEPRVVVEESRDPEIDESSASAGVRVPWLRYSESPVRHGPAADRNESQRPVAPSGIAPDSRIIDQSYEPLLTAEELAALLGDDPDDLANRETGN